MKKKLFTFGVAAVLSLTSGMAVSAEPQIITQNEGTSSQDVYATYSSMVGGTTVYSVEIKWGSMEFTYNAPTKIKVWNPKTHTYDETTSSNATWTNEDGANMVSLTNKSNKALKATLSATVTEDSEYSGIQVKIPQEPLYLEDASKGASIDTAGVASKAEAVISLAGELTNKTADKVPIGQITVSIADAQEVTP